MVKKEKNSNKNILVILLHTLLIIGVLFSLFAASYQLRQGDIHFNTDIARDFLLIEDIVVNQNITLLGPRSGAISGLFHGPLWLYLNVPAFILGSGDPVSIGWFWFLLVVSAIGIVFYVGKKMFSTTIGLISALLTSMLLATSTGALFNPFGAVLLSPVFFYLLWKYIENKDWRYLILCIFTIGIIIQFQVAFGGPILVLTFLLVAYPTYKQKKLAHLLTFFILVIPFSTYAVFDIRHDFLQIKSVVNYMTEFKESKYTFEQVLLNRIDGIRNTLTLVPYPTKIIILSVAAYLIAIYVQVIRSKNNKTPYLLYAYFFIGFWLMTLLLKGRVWGYYYWPFVPLTAIILSSGIQRVPKIFAGIVISLLLLSSFQSIRGYESYLAQDFIGKDSGSWKFNKELADIIFKQNDKEFGYFIFSPDEYGYSPKYAMNFVGRQTTGKQIFPYEKKQVTYLIISGPGGENNGLEGGWWKENRVKITSMPDKKWDFPNKFSIEKHTLTKDEQEIQADTNLIDSLIFR